MKYRDITKRFAQLGCVRRQGKGDHEVWTCPCGQHRAVITQTSEISPGLIRSAIKNLECLQGKEWWK